MNFNLGNPKKSAFGSMPTTKPVISNPYGSMPTTKPIFTLPSSLNGAGISRGGMRLAQDRIKLGKRVY